jgi:hypothetical protein
LQELIQAASAQTVEPPAFLAQIAELGGQMEADIHEPYWETAMVLLSGLDHIDDAVRSTCRPPYVHNHSRRIERVMRGRRIDLVESTCAEAREVPAMTSGFPMNKDGSREATNVGRW